MLKVDPKAVADVARGSALHPNSPFVSVARGVVDTASVLHLQVHFYFNGLAAVIFYAVDTVSEVSCELEEVTD